MKYLALVIGVFVMAVGTAGLFVPETLLSFARFATTSAGLYAIAAIRVAIGIVFMLVAPRSRAPKTLRMLGAFVLVAGLATPLIGVERVQAIIDWETTHGTALLRLGAGVALLIGGFIAYAVAPGRRAS